MFPASFGDNACVTSADRRTAGWAVGWHWLREEASPFVQQTGLLTWMVAPLLLGCDHTAHATISVDVGALGAQVGLRWTLIIYAFTQKLFEVGRKTQAWTER